MEKQPDNDDDASFVVLGSDSMPSINSTSLSLDSKDIHWRIDHLIKENAALKDALNQNNADVKCKFENLAKWQQDLVDAHRNNIAKFAETRELVLKLKSENAELKKIVTFNKLDQTQEISDLKKKASELSLENELLRVENSKIRTEFARKFQEMEAMLRMKSEEVCILRGNYSSLAYNADSSGACLSETGALSYATGEEWSLLQNSKKELEYSVQRLQLQVERLTEEIQTEKKKSQQLKQDVDDAKESLKEKCEENSFIFEKLNHNLKETQTELTKAKNEVEQKENLLKAAVSELKKIHEKTSNDEEITFLNAQLEVYRKDYQEEREAREKLAEERENLAETVRLLRAKLSRLEGRGDGINGEQPNEDVSTSEHIEEVFFTCPICQRRYQELRECERHANNCLETHMLP